MPYPNTYSELIKMLIATDLFHVLIISLLSLVSLPFFPFAQVVFKICSPFFLQHCPVGDRVGMNVVGTEIVRAPQGPDYPQEGACPQSMSRPVVTAR